MSEFKRIVPQNVRELSDALNKLKDNQKHVKGVTVNPNNAHLEVKVDGMAHFAGVSDFYLPLKRAKVVDATNLVEKMLKEFSQGFPASGAEVSELFEDIDPANQ